MNLKLDKIEPEKGTELFKVTFYAVMDKDRLHQLVRELYGQSINVEYQG